MITPSPLRAPLDFDRSPSIMGDSDERFSPNKRDTDV